MLAFKVSARRVSAVLALSISALVHGQHEEPRLVTHDALPILMYDIDVGVGYGAKAFLLNYFGGSESFDVTLFTGTKGKRWYRFVFSRPDFERRQLKQYPFAVDFRLDFDKDIKRSFFGIGNGTSFEDREHYTREPFSDPRRHPSSFTTS